MAPFESLYGRRFWSPFRWFEEGESSLLGTHMIDKSLEMVWMIKDRLKTAYSRQKSYADHRRRDLEFEKGDKVYLKISPMEGVVRFSKK